MTQRNNFLRLERRFWAGLDDSIAPRAEGGEPPDAARRGNCSATYVADIQRGRAVYSHDLGVDAKASILCWSERQQLESGSTCNFYFFIPNVLLRSSAITQSIQNSPAVSIFWVTQAAFFSDIAGSFWVSTVKMEPC